MAISRLGEPRHGHPRSDNLHVESLQSALPGAQKLQLLQNSMMWLLTGAEYYDDVIFNQNTFENSNTTAATKLPAAKSVSLHPRSSPRGPPEWVGGSQHLKNLSKTVGAKVNDLLRRKETSNHSSFGVTEVNERAGAALSCGQGTLDQEEWQAPVGAIPRLNPPPEIAKKRTPRALKTTQDMLIASQPSVGSIEASFPEGRSQDHAFQREARKEAARSEIGLLTLEEVGTSHSRARGVPDLIYKENLEPKLNTAYRIPPSPENVALQLSLSAGKSPPECQFESSVAPSTAETSTLEAEGHSPDLLSFE
ncbi:uncharacterized protein C1orf226 homolog [Zootoca vivipara]|uniref:uncharacterized protein C1orf226 homolog n=1 Tax=Zootoca vivipara TaxID=8524 RepID=UPI00293B95BA|nr:uncharacterized protein C1orf226 homolog [Zootoca vivipara]